MSKPPPRFGVWAPHHGKWVVNPDVEDVVAPFSLGRDVAISADRAGFDTVLFAQHTINGGNQESETLEPWSACAAVAALTDRIEIIAAIKPLLYHPVILAKLALGIEDISHGRFAINFVNAFTKPELVKSGIGFPAHDERYAYGAEWLRIVKALIAGETVTHEGAKFRVTDYNLKPVSQYRNRPYIYAGGESEPARDLAAELVDSLLINGRSPEETLEIIQAVSRRQRIGPPVQFGLTGFVATRPTDNEADEFLEELYRLRGDSHESRRLQQQANTDLYDPKALHVTNRFKYTSRQMIGANGGVVPGFVGSYDRVARRIVEFYDLGITTFLLSFFPLIEEQELFASEVIPRVRFLLGAHKAS